MFSNSIQFRVRYGETDQMGYVYHGNYPQYFEMGRIEWLRELGISYKQMELDGIMLPVAQLDMQFLKPAVYDDLLTLETTLVERPSAKIIFHYELFNENKDLLTTAQVKLVFVNMKTNRPTRPPENLLTLLDDLVQKKQ